MDTDDIENGEKNCEKGLYEFLNSKEIDAETDFSDPASLLRRQKKLLKQVEEHKNKENDGFDPL
jgi:hypothetical protein